MHIDLDAKLRELDRETNPPTLTLRNRTYTFRAVVPFEASLRLAEAPEFDDDPDGWRAGIIEFIAALIVDTDQDDWLDATLNREKFPDELMMETIVQLSAEYAARPMPPSTDSLPSPGNDGRNSNSTPSPPASATSAA